MTEDAYSSSGARRADRETSGTAIGLMEATEAEELHAMETAAAGSTQ
jgi:hypothetical protein